MRVDVIDDRTAFDNIDAGTPEDPDKTIRGHRSRTITIDCDYEAGDLIIQFVRALQES